MVPDKHTDSVSPSTTACPSALFSQYFKEIKADIGTDAPPTGNLTRWAEGVLLLNATLTVRAHQAGSHQNRGWETFTDAAIRISCRRTGHLVFILWGAYAQRKGAFYRSQQTLGTDIRTLLLFPHTTVSSETNISARRMNT